MPDTWASLRETFLRELWEAFERLIIVHALTSQTNIVVKFREWLNSLECVGVETPLNKGRPLPIARAKDKAEKAFREDMKAAFQRVEKRRQEADKQRRNAVSNAISNAVRTSAKQAKADNRKRNAEHRARLVKMAKDKGAAPLCVDEHDRCNCPPRVYCHRCPEAKRLEAAAAAVDLETRFHASTNVVFSMDLPDDVLRERIETCMSVSDEQKARLAAAWASSRAAHGRAIPACASCGIRHPLLDYHRVQVACLPPVFKLTADERARRDRLGSVCLAAAPAEGTPPGTPPVFHEAPVDLRPIMSCWPRKPGPDDELFHLHPELVDEIGAGEPSVLMCEHCHAAVGKGAATKADAPKLSIAAGIDFGLLSRVHTVDPSPPVSVCRSCRVSAFAIDLLLVFSHGWYIKSLVARLCLVTFTRPFQVIQNVRDIVPN